MRIMKEFPKESKCPICGTNINKECVLIGISNTIKDNISEANIYHLDCLELLEIENDFNEKLIYQRFINKGDIK